MEPKFHPPPARLGIVPRTVLVERLLGSDAAPIIGVVAPAGYGKTTLLAQWAERTGRPVAWVAVDQHDNDPVVLLSDLAAGPAVGGRRFGDDRAGCRGPGPRGTAGQPGVP
ncbi:MAG TPA: hypothetical protein VGW74_21600 [Propionibacteriaceae bacterium]|nr:hypothetical protein [Propionibacteriaceae bacterium]